MAPKNEPAAQPTRLVIADVDGTLVTQDKVLTKRAIEAVMRLHEAGIQFTVTSGRPPRGMAMLIDPLKLTLPLAAFNGGVLIQPDLKTVVDQKFLPAGVPEQVIEAAEPDAGSDGQQEKAKECYDQAMRWWRGQTKLAPHEVAELRALRTEADAVLKGEMLD